MAAPATSGRLCTKLEEMEIGDYIRCSYIAPIVNEAGNFMDLGGADTVAIELPTEPGVTADGYFYFLKVDKGLLAADRAVQAGISAASLNAKNYLHGSDVNGNLMRSLSITEWAQYLTNGDLNGSIEKQDTNVWHKEIIPTYDEIDNGHYGSRSYNCMLEITHTISNGNVGTTMNLSGKAYDTNYHVYARCIDSVAVADIYQSFSQTQYSRVANFRDNRIITLNIYNCFRPTLEYIDNKNSKTIWY